MPILTLSISKNSLKISCIYSSNEKINGFSLKFQREFEKNKRTVKWSIMQILQQEIRSLCLFVRDSDMKILGR